MTRIVFMLTMCCALNIQAQQLFPTLSKSKTEPAYEVQLDEAIIVSSRIFTNDTARYHYNQLKHYVKIVLPYVNQATKLFNDIQRNCEGLSKKNRKKYVKTREKEIKEAFEDRLSALNITQGRLLVKLIHRQLSITCYDIIKDLRNPVSASYYQSWAKLNGINLNEDYNPDENKDLEQIMRGLGY